MKTKTANRIFATFAVIFFGSILGTFVFGMLNYFAGFAGCAGIVFFGSLILLTITILNRKLGRWVCEVLGWHLPPEAQTFDGCSLGGRCPRCNKRVLQDSQGGWFSIGD